MSDFGVQPLTNQPAPDLTPIPLAPTSPTTPTPTTPVPVAPSTPSLPTTFQQQIAANLAGNTVAQSPGPSVAPFFQSQPTNPSALIPNLDSTRAAFIKKYQRYAPQLATIPAPIRASLISTDLSRINKGQMPLSDDETLHALSSAISGNAATLARHDTSIFGRITHLPDAAVTDLGNVLKGAARLVEPNRGNIVYQELFHNLPHWGKIYQENRAAGLNPIAAFLQSPGIRFIPGSFIASNLASGAHGLGNLLDHPVFAALDALPYASEAAKLTEIGGVAAAEGVRPLNALLTKSLLPEDAAIPKPNLVAGIEDATTTRLVPNRLGAVGEAAKQTSIGNWVTQAFGAQSRGLSKILGTADAYLHDVLKGNSPIEEGTKEAFARNSYSNAAEQTAKDLGIPLARRRAITQQFELDPNGREWITQLPENEAAFAREAIKLRSDADVVHDALGETGVAPNGERYPIKQLNKILKAQKVVDAAHEVVRARLPQLESLVSDAKPVPGSGEWHGTSRRFANDSIGDPYGASSAKNLYGPGLYTTDDFTVAEGYTAKGRGGDPVIYDVKWAGKKEPNFVDIDTTPVPVVIAQSITNHILPHLGDASLESISAVEEALVAGRPIAEVYRAIRTAVREHGYTMSDADELFHGLNDQFQTAGYDGFTHRGGGIWGDGPSHQVKIYFPDKVAEGALKIAEADPLGHLSPRARLARERATNLLDAVNRALDPNDPGTMQDVADLITNAKKSRAAYGSSRTGTDPLAPEPNIRLDTLNKLHTEVRNAAKLEKTLLKENARIPARYIPMVRDLAESEYKDAMVSTGVDPAAAARAIYARDFSAYPEFSRVELDNLIREHAKTWQDLKAAGADPLYVHHVNDGALGALKYPRAMDFARDISASKPRKLTAEPQPYIRDVSIALAHEGVELLSRDVNQSVMDSIMDAYGQRQGTLLERFRATAEDMASRDPGIDPLRKAEELARKGSAPYNPKAFNRMPVPSMANPEQIWLPRAIIDNLNRLHNPSPNAMGAILGTPTNIFRLSVLGLSPRFAVNNVFGNGFIQLAENGPGAFRWWSEAHRLIEEAKAGSTEIPLEIRGSSDLARKEIADNPINTRETERGAKLADIWNKTSESRVIRGIKYVIDKNYDLNAFFDDHNRLMSYLYGQSKALGKGLSEAEAHAAGLEAAYRTSMFWHDLTPIERNVLRQVFPFYAFTSKMLRFVTRYPFDHPARAAILSNITRAEIADQKDGLGYNWLNSIGLGPVHSNGHQLQLSLTGLNPFYDVANQYTLKGFLGNLNPVIESVLEAGGIGPGQQYASQHYDPITGKLQPTNASLPSALLGNLIPQTKAIDALLHPGSQGNGSAANRVLAGALGLPTSIRDIDVPAQYFTAELAREKDQAAVLKAAMASGDYSIALQYPALVPLVRAIQSARDNGLLSAYTPTGTTQGALDVLASAGRGVTGG